MYPSSVTNLEQAWAYLPVFKLGRYVTAPASVNSATVVCLVYPPVTTNLSSISIPQAYLNNVKHYFSTEFCHLLYFQTLSLFPGSHGHVVLGAVCSAETVSFAVLGLLNKIVLAGDSSNMFLLLFLTLAGCSLLGRAF